MRAIITVVGQDTVGILAAVSQVCAARKAKLSEVAPGGGAARVGLGLRGAGVGG